MKYTQLKDIDELIERADEFDSGRTYLTELAKLIILYLEKDTNIEKINYNSLLKKEFDQSKKRFIALCLLRVYGKNSELIKDRSLKHSIHSLFESSIEQIYNPLAYKDKKKLQTYEIENRLKSFVVEFEERINSKIDSEVTLDDIDVFEKYYNQTIKFKKNKPLLDQFMFHKFDKQLFDKAFKLIKEYNAIEEKFELYKRALEIFDKIIYDSNRIGTKYAIDFINKPFLKIKENLIKDFKNNPIAEPAILSVEKTEKKYPFKKGLNYTIQLLIKNISTGYANDTNINITLYSEDIIKLEKTEQYIGHIKTESIIEFNYETIDSADSILLYGDIEWTNFNQERKKSQFELELEGQKSEIDWVKIEEEEPYDLEPVTNENEFIGRSKIITDLKKVKKKVNSSYIFGQRRVGKTSIVKTLISIIEAENMLIFYAEAGDWGSAKSPHDSMNNLGEKICNKIIRYNTKFSSLNMPEFNGSFNQITDFLDKVTEIDDKFHLLIILDEFDRVSNKLIYEGSATAESFMSTIRAISNREQFGFILVGGEKLEDILSDWQDFNKFKPMRVDYFDKKNEWEDFKNLIKLPVKEILEVTDEAIEYIYIQTSGNPYFTKKICMELFSLMVTNRDNHVTEVEVKKAISIARSGNNIGATDFSHFWKDGINENEEKEISIHRKKVLLSIGQLLKINNKTTKEAIVNKSVANGLDEVQANRTLEDFVRRKIIKINDDSQYSFIVKFFEDWLIDSGLNKIITTFEEEQSIILKNRYEEEISIKPKEINSLSQKWESYKGKEITTDTIRDWLEQFNNKEEQRIIFNLLENIKFYTNIEIREKMEELFKLVKKEILQKNQSTKSAGRKKEGIMILVSYLDPNPVKSGAEYAKKFIEANNLYKDNSSTPDKLREKIIEDKNITTLVFIDDFIGTGNSIIENIEPILDSCEKEIKERNISIIIGVITGFQEAKYKIEKFIEKSDLSIAIKLLDSLDNRDKCFDDDSSIYTKYIERKKAKDICYKIGQKLEKNHPLGYNNCQAIVVFPDTCPNNTLPILWKGTNSWRPIFKRG